MVAARDADHVLVEDMAIGDGCREPDISGAARSIPDPGGSEEIVVALRIALTRRRPLIEIRQLGRNHGCLNGIQAEVAADDAVVILRL